MIKELGEVVTTHAELLDEEKMMLYSLVRGLKPSLALEIGVFQGGSSKIILDAMEENEQGELWSIDPAPQVVTSGNPMGRWHLLTVGSPRGIHQVINQTAGDINFAFIDGDHSQAAVETDIKTLLPYLSGEAWLLFHDACNPEVQRAIDIQLAWNRYNLDDCGLVCKTGVYLPHMNAEYYGLRLLRYTRS